MNIFSVALLSTVFALLLATNLQAKDRSIVIVHSYAMDLPEWVDGQETGFRNVVGHDYTYQTYYMDTKRIPAEEFDIAANQALDLISSTKPDLVYLTDDNATKLVGRFVDSEIPVVFSGVNANIRNAYPWIVESPNITGVLERPLIQRSILEISKLTGLDASNMLVILGDSATGKAFFQNDLNEKRRISFANLRGVVETPDTIETWKTLIQSSRAAGHSGIMVGGLFGLKDASGAIADGYKLAQWISEHSPLPVISVQQQAIGHDMLIGGMFMSGRLMGREAGLIAKKILEGPNPKTIGPLQQRGRVFTFSEAQLEKWNLAYPVGKPGQITFVK